jgi:hypothetical protein
MPPHITSQILMVRPSNFAFNPETSVNNTFQKNIGTADLQDSALGEFDGMVAELRQQGIRVLVVDDDREPLTPDSIFPNNWVSTELNGTVILFPMFAANRRAEREKQVLETIEDQFKMENILDLTHFEDQGLFLEGTGSMVIDRPNHMVYTCRSARTSEIVLNEYCEDFGYRYLLFSATDREGRAIYHTNVMLCVADRYVVVCLEALADEKEKEALINKFIETGKEVISISLDQMEQFAGNMLQLKNIHHDKFVVMSSRAFNSLTGEQISRLEAYNKIIHVPLSTIETAGGGSARCMMAEIFLSEK